MCCCIERSERRSRCEVGQTTVEAAFLLPILCFALALLLQPALLLYCRCVMESAAAESCRLVATASCDDDAVEGFIKRRLAALPEMSLFHSKSCDWEIEFERGMPSTVRIRNHVAILPLLGISASTLTKPAGDGCALLDVEASSNVRPLWLAESSSSPEEWVDRWD